MLVPLAPTEMSSIPSRLDLLLLAAHADEIAQPDQLLVLLQQAVITVFKEAPADDIVSGEEAKVTLAKAVGLFHAKGAQKHAAVFQHPDYHQHAALFIHELLNSLSGNSQKWFRELQLESLAACHAILRTIGWRTTRLCTPGIVSATVRYIERARRGKDASAVLLSAVDLLRLALVSALSTTEDAAWLETAMVHLSETMRHLLNPKTVTENGSETAVVRYLSVLLGDLLVSPAVQAHQSCNFVHEAMVAYAVVDNLRHLQDLSGAASSDAMPTLTNETFASADGAEALCDAMQRLRGVELLHVCTFVLRHPQTRGLLVAHGESAALLFGTIMSKCTRLVGTEMPEDIYTCRAVRRFPSGVVDEFLETLAHALAELPVGLAAANEETAGEFLTNVLIDSSDALLQDWDMYLLHPATIYVISRVVVWQFKPVPIYLGRFFLREGVVLPEPADLTATGAFEQLWSVVATPHLWDITMDEDLCNYQQIKHRQTVAATILRVLALTASDVMHYAVVAGQRTALVRFTTLTLYLVMEKAAAAGIVREAAMNCVEAYTAASACEDALNYFLGASSCLVDDASRAVKVEHLRQAAASVLRGAVGFVLRKLRCGSSSSGGEPEGGKGDTLHGTMSSCKLPALVRQRMSIEHVAHVQANYSVSTEDINRIATFTSAVVRVATSCCQEATAEGDASGTKAALVLLRDSCDIASVVHYMSPLEPSDEDHERQTSSVNPCVKHLQESCHSAIFAVLATCSTNNAATLSATQAVLRCLMVQLTTREAESWIQRALEARADKLRDTRVASRLEAAELPGPVDGESDVDEVPPSPLVSPPILWLQEDTDPLVVLPRSHLKTVYRIYMCYITMLKEPVALFTTNRGKSRQRSAAERRQLEQVRVVPAFFALLEGLQSLFVVATEFMAHRMVEEILPLTLVWYEKACLPRIPTDTDGRVREAVRTFAVAIHHSVDAAMQMSVRERCEPYFQVVKEGEPAGTNPTEDAQSAVLGDDIASSRHHNKVRNRIDITMERVTAGGDEENADLSLSRC